MTTLIEQLARFAVEVTATDLPDDVVHESQRILLDTLGCAVASLDDEGAQRGVAHGRVIGAGTPESSVIGTREKVSHLGAAFANAELVNALDQDAVLPPGHVTPYVVPGALALAEATGASGATLLEALAIGHEMSYRIGKCTDYLRDIKDGVVVIPKVIGYASTLFGATAAVGKIKGFDAETMADALGIAGCSSPVNFQRSWMMHAPSTTIKYQLAGQMAFTALTAASLAELGHTGDRQLLDDREFGWPRFIGTSRWEPAPITDGLGQKWTFTPFQSFKPYPHCRVMHAIFDALTEIVDEQDLAPEDIESITAWGESFVLQPNWLNENITNPRDAQFSMTHGLAMAAHRIPPGKDWQTLEAVLRPSVLALTERSHFEPHPDHAAALAKDPAARVSKVEVRAHGKVFTGERAYPKGSPSKDPETYMTDEQLIAKFSHNVDGVVAETERKTVVDAAYALTGVDNVATILELLAPR
ncbi:MmgE/PrpD family protein [Gordonia sp. X0973]|uniref:MmgE/PrpD family protein n=1 Tax=Gordonia sp. X0973 TaxID=2742602 RepID=UPI000F51DF01|nr:MmgE/PrpD family protein [Gordonia sp. X0973]QKT08820.1 MmgE/PrpD family protein [Gordonia sp. X0973]